MCDHGSKGWDEDQEGRIWDHRPVSPGIRDHRPWDRDQQFFRDQGSGTKIGHAFGIKDQKFEHENGISDKKNIPRYHPAFVFAQDNFYNDIAYGLLQSRQ